jgi:hypothetical protein
MQYIDKINGNCASASFQASSSPFIITSTTPKHREVVTVDHALFKALQRAGIEQAGDGDRLTDAQFDLLRQQSDNTWKLTEMAGRAGILPASVKADRPLVG